ncbi:MAG: FAD-dependent oxidoreductase [Clostridiales bacterium]|nr:FAD-dependent oxidoreductase [Clostridiales bacterium]
MYELAVIGGGPAGLAAAYSAYTNGVKKIVILERDKELGGILNQCIHNGFGLHRFKEELSGPEYAHRFIDMLKDTSVEVRLDTMVIDITPEKKIYTDNPSGYDVIEAESIVLAMGCRERTRGAISIPGTRPSGVFTAGAAQRYLNMEGLMAGSRVVILGSGDIGLIMARRLTLEGAKVLACVELMPYSGGLTRNIVQCLHDFDIPLYLSHTVTEVRGDKRLTGVTVAKVDENRRPIPGTEMDFDCDTLLLSVGLIPENELTRAAGIEMDPRTNGAYVFENMETSIPGVFACGNAVHVHDLVDFVSDESSRAGVAAAAYIKGEKHGGDAIPFKNGSCVTYTVPQKLHKNTTAEKTDVFFRVNKVFSKSRIVVSDENGVIASFNRPFMAPGEMQHIIIPTNKLKGSESITISAEEATQQ